MMRYLVVGQRDDVTEAFSCVAKDKSEAEEKFHEWIREDWGIDDGTPTGFDVVLISAEKNWRDDLERMKEKPVYFPDDFELGYYTGYNSAIEEVIELLEE